MDRAFRQANLRPEPRLSADTRDAVYEAVAVGLGVGDERNALVNLFFVAAEATRLDLA